MELNFSSVETIPGLNASAAFQVDSGKVFKEDVDMAPTIIDKSLSYMPWGGDNMMPYNILKLIEDDETLSTCQQFNAEVCYGSGLKYDTEACTALHTYQPKIVRAGKRVAICGTPQSAAPQHSSSKLDSAFGLHDCCDEPSESAPKKKAARKRSAKSESK